MVILRNLYLCRASFYFAADGIPVIGLSIVESVFITTRSAGLGALSGRLISLLPEVVVFLDRLVDFPGTFKVFGEDHEVARAEIDRILAVADSDLALD